MTKAEAFANRKEKGTALEIEVDDYLISKGIKFIRTSFENRYSKEEVKILTLNPEFFSIRMAPDRLLTDYSLLLEVSNSKMIVRKKYNYLYKEFKNCYIVSETLFCVKMSDITFEIPRKRCWGLPFDIPIEDTYWRNPGLLPKEQYELFMEKAIEKKGSTSGDSAAFIDWKQSNAIHINDLLRHG